MADSIVRFVLENLSRLVAHEANLLCDVEDKVKFLESHLGMMSVFLESCEQNQRKKPIEQEILRQIKDIAHEAEDVIDTFVVNVANYRRRSRLARILHGASHAKLRRQVAKNIDSINARLDYLHENKIKYDNTQEAAGSSTDQELQLLHKRRKDVEEYDVVGFQDDTAEVINRLKQGDSHRVVPIIGMGGLGKTTLARKIYNSDDVKNHFECFAWVSVSNDYRPRELLLALLKYLMSTSANASYYNNNSSSKHKKKSKGKGKAESDDFHSLSEKELKDKVRECLKGKRYLVVLDDIWTPQHWDDIQSAFPDDNRSSRILITSRLGEVASRASPSPPYYLPFLNQEESWELFSKRVFRGGEGVPSDLEPLGEWMVKSCGGLPLSIVVLAGILANKEKSYRVWSNIKDHVNSYLAVEDADVHDIVLKLSYDSLPQRLKPCFLYFGMFPEDHEIPVRRLIHLWVAEGFILRSDSRIVEDVADFYLDELIDRSLIQVGRRRSDGGIKTCRIHDLLRELCIYKGKKEKFFEVCRAADTNLDQNKPRRISIQCKMIDFLVSENKDLSATRSMLCFDCSKSDNIDSSMSKGLVRQIQLVRVLGMRLPISFHHKIPIDFNMLVHLRYLRLHIGRRSVFGKFQLVIINSICNLWNLETLELEGQGFEFGISFSSGICKLKRLRHLVARRLMIWPEQSSDVESKTMLNLQTLSDVVINKKSAILSLIGKGVFPNLRKLGLSYDDEEEGVSQVGENLRNLNDLNTLKIDDFPDILMSVNAFPSNLTKLTISKTNLNDNVMSTLGSLDNLRILKIRFCSVARRLCSINGFPKLEVFQVFMSSLFYWELGKDVMSCLRHLVIEECGSLIALPDELWSLTSLREVKVEGPFSESLKEQLQRQPMRDGCNLIISREREREMERICESIML